MFFIIFPHISEKRCKALRRAPFFAVWRAAETVRTGNLTAMTRKYKKRQNRPYFVPPFLVYWSAKEKTEALP